MRLRLVGSVGVNYTPVAGGKIGEDSEGARERMDSIFGGAVSKLQGYSRLTRSPFVVVRMILGF
jgi:hypothetical protein